MHFEHWGSDGANTKEVMERMKSIRIDHWKLFYLTILCTWNAY